MARCEYVNFPRSNLADISRRDCIATLRRRARGFRQFDRRPRRDQARARDFHQRRRVEQVIDMPVRDEDRIGSRRETFHGVVDTLRIRLSRSTKNYRRDSNP